MLASISVCVAMVLRIMGAVWEQWSVFPLLQKSRPHRGHFFKNFVKKNVKVSVINNSSHILKGLVTTNLDDGFLHKMSAWDARKKQKNKRKLLTDSDGYR